ncbi:MAG: radical SAM protein [Gemmatimonadetes bacterium]|nr:radical SAM protein [Gemmatimonadota bacterium]MBI3566611.1 radical SAM protein [Gemmatimonadota bacterium]
MLSKKFRPWHIVPFSLRYAKLRLLRRPVLVHFEVTMRCNAGCGFCDYWKTDPSEKARELTSFADAARHFAPMMITFTGGEPLLRRDLEEIVAEVDRAVPYTWLSLITHGGMLSLERAESLWDAGLAQFCVSLDYLDARHDDARKIPGLAAKILRTVPAMVERGMTVRFNTVIKNDNLDSVLPIVRFADEVGAGVNLSVYTDFKNGNAGHRLGAAHGGALDALVRDLLAFKRARRGVISNSDWYVSQIPRWVRGELTEPCRSGETTIHIDPVGRVRRCPDFPSDEHWSTYQGYQPIACDRCYYACRGEAQAPLTITRFQDLFGSTGRRRAPVPLPLAPEPETEPGLVA